MNVPLGPALGSRLQFQELSWRRQEFADGADKALVLGGATAVDPRCEGDCHASVVSCVVARPASIMQVRTDGLSAPIVRQVDSVDSSSASITAAARELATRALPPPKCCRPVS